MKSIKINNKTARYKHSSITCFLFILLLFICAPSTIFGNETITDESITNIDTVAQEHSQIAEDSVQTNEAIEKAVLDSAQPEEVSDEFAKESAQSDSITAGSPSSHTKLTIVRREHDYKRQAWMAVGMMTFIAIILGTSQSWNPR